MQTIYKYSNRRILATAPSPENGKTRRDPCKGEVLDQAGEAISASSKAKVGDRINLSLNQPGDERTMARKIKLNSEIPA
jgi:hypothetical protein